MLPFDLLKKSEKLALMYDSEDGFFLAFSAGKDSQALYHVAQMAGVKFKAHINWTSVDPPQVIRFKRKHYPDVVYGKLYGPTECTEACTYYTIDRPFIDDEVLPIGRPCYNCEVIVLDESDNVVTYKVTD